MKTVILIIVLILPILGDMAPCTDYECDTLVVREILDENGISESAVSVIDTAENRVIALKITEKGMKTLPSKIERISNLITIVMDKNELTNIPREIGNLVMLKGLSFDGNKLSTIPTEINNLKELRGFNFQNNLLTDLSNISDSLQVTMVKLSGNPLKIETLPVFPYAQTIAMSGCKISTLPNNFKKHRNLKTLTLRMNEFTTIPAVLCEIPYIEHMNFDRNKIVKLPTDFYKIDYLTNLSLETNHLVEFPKEIFKCSNLQVLVLTDNKISKISKEIEKCKELRELIMSRNDLEELPKEIMNLNLLKLSVRRNHICEISDDLGMWLDKYGSLWRTTQYVKDSTLPFPHLCDVVTDIKNPNKSKENRQFFIDTHKKRISFLPNKRTTSLSIYTLLGKKVVSIKGDKKQMLNYSKWTKGIYCVTVQTKNGMVTEKFVNQ